MPWARTLDPRISTDASRTVVAGQSLGALTALLTALRHPEQVGSVISQSASLWLIDLTDEEASLSPRADSATVNGRAYCEVGTNEWVLTPLHRQVMPQLRSFWDEFTYVEYDGGHDDVCWRGTIADGLQAVLGTG